MIWDIKMKKIHTKQKDFTVCLYNLHTNALTTESLGFFLNRMYTYENLWMICTVFYRAKYLQKIIVHPSISKVYEGSI